MIKELTASVSLWGERFSPQMAAERTGFVLTDKNEPGELGTRGRYKGISTPYGSASFEAPEEIDQFDRILWLANALKGKVEVLRECGATEMYYYIGYFHDGQCNCTLEEEEISAMAETGLDFWFSCYDATEEEEAEPIDDGNAEKPPGVERSQ